MHRGDARRVRVPGRGKFDGTAVDVDFAFIGLVEAGHDLDQGRFPGPVLAHQRMNFAGAHGEAYGIDDTDAGKGLRHGAKLYRQAAGRAK